MVKYGMNVLLWSDDALDDKLLPVFERLKGMGYDGVELPVFAPQAASKYRDLGHRLDDLGLKRTCVTISTPENNPISPEAANRKGAVDNLKSVLDCCREAGMQLLVGPYYAALGAFSGRGPTSDEWKWGADAMRQVAEHGRKVGVGLALEFLNRFEIYLLNCAADTDRFVREIGIPGCGTLYDTFHANIEEKDVGEAMRACAGTLAHVHVSENDRSTPGSGSVRWEETFRALKEARYDGWLTIEAFGTFLPSLTAATKIWRKMYRDEDQLARDGLAFMKKMATVSAGR
jgi:D-psicose/D-tagatose/L-ribulose 3-epimerase